MNPQPINPESEAGPRPAAVAALLIVAAALVLTAVALFTLHAAPPQKASLQPMPNNDVPNDDAITEFTFWDRGGAPGPSYQQNLLSVAREGAQGPWRAVFTKVRWDKAAPPYRSDKYTLPLKDPARVASILQAARAAFADAFPEEKESPTGDVTKISLTLEGDDGREVSKTFYVRMPASLGATSSLFEEVMTQCEREGVHETL